MENKENEKNDKFYGPIIPEEFFDFGWNYLCEPTYGNIYMTLHRIRIKYSQPTEFDAEFFTTDIEIIKLCKVSRKSLNNFRKWAINVNLIHPIANHRHIGSATVYRLTYPIPELNDEIRKACNRVTLSSKSKRVKKELKKDSIDSEIRKNNPKGCNRVTESVNVGDMKGVIDTPHSNYKGKSENKTLIPIPNMSFSDENDSVSKDKDLKVSTPVSQPPNRSFKEKKIYIFRQLVEYFKSMADKSPDTANKERFQKEAERIEGLITTLETAKVGE